MSYRGHVAKGVVVLDEPVELAEGMQVVVLVQEGKNSNAMPLRGTAYRFDEPFAPAVDESDWDAAR